MMPGTRSTRGGGLSLANGNNMAAKKAAKPPIHAQQMRMAKRKAEELLQPDKGAKSKKRAALGEITNAWQETSQKAQKGLTKILNRSMTKLTNSGQKAATHKKAKIDAAELKLQDDEVDSSTGETRSLLSSQEAFKAGEIEEVPQDEESDEETFESAMEEVVVTSQPLDQVVPKGVFDFDATNRGCPHQGEVYVRETFQYYKSREADFLVPDYMGTTQCEVTVAMRAILVDWMVEVQESFELNHETLYTGVKMVDIYLSRCERVPKNRLQLVGACALLIACKIDERIPPLLDDFVYVCDDAYTKDEIVAKEIDMITTVGYDVGYPITYRFLRRYGRVCQASMPVLTFARYIMELSLMEYELNHSTSESRLATAAMCLALTIKDRDGEWRKTLEHYSGYKLEEVRDLVDKLHAMLMQAPHESRNTIRTKYSHHVFHMVARTEIPRVV